MLSHALRVCRRRYPVRAQRQHGRCKCSTTGLNSRRGQPYLDLTRSSQQAEQQRHAIQQQQPSVLPSPSAQSRPPAISANSSCDHAPPSGTWPTALATGRWSMRDAHSRTCREDRRTDAGTARTFGLFHRSPNTLVVRYRFSDSVAIIFIFPPRPLPVIAQLRATAASQTALQLGARATQRHGRGRRPLFTRRAFTARKCNIWYEIVGIVSFPRNNLPIEVGVRLKRTLLYVLGLPETSSDARTRRIRRNVELHRRILPRLQRSAGASRPLRAHNRRHQDGDSR
jgi:hypothetical protein